jgi:hypothetical protein
MHWLKLKRHKSHSSNAEEVWVNIDNLVSIAEYRDDGCFCVFVGGIKECFYNRPDDLMKTIAELFNGQHEANNTSSK